MSGSLKNKALLLALALFGGGVTWAQEMDYNLNNPAPVDKSKRWVPLTGGDAVLLRPCIFYDDFNFAIDTYNGKSLDWEPNVGLGVGADFYFKDFLGLTLGFLFPSNNVDAKGNTTAYDFRFAFAFEHFYYQLDFQHYKGFYTKSDGDSPEPLLNPSMTVDNLSLRAIYTIDSDKFSVEALRDQSAQQLSSGGSWLLGAYIGYIQASSPDGLVPEPLQASLGQDGLMQRAWSLSAQGRGGYGYSWVFLPKFFLGAYGLFGLGPEQTYFNYGGSSASRDRTQLGFSAAGFASLGYTGNEFSTSVGADAEELFFAAHSTALNRGILGVAWNVGWRF